MVGGVGVLGREGAPGRERALSLSQRPPASQMTISPSSPPLRRQEVSKYVETCLQIGQDVYYNKSPTGDSAFPLATSHLSRWSAVTDSALGWKARQETVPGKAGALDCYRLAPGAIHIDQT